MWRSYTQIIQSFYKTWYTYAELTTKQYCSFIMLIINTLCFIFQPEACRFDPSPYSQYVDVSFARYLTPSGSRWQTVCECVWMLAVEQVVLPCMNGANDYKAIWGVVRAQRTQIRLSLFQFMVFTTSNILKHNISYSHRHAQNKNIKDNQYTS